MRFFYTALVLILFTSAKAQNFNGQWRGVFSDKSMSLLGISGDNIDYVLEVQCNGNEVNGYSYTYFTEAGKRYYTICKLSGSINRATKEIVVTEYERIKYNTPPDFSNCFQTHRLKYIKENEDTETLQGTWVPAPNQAGGCGYGRTTLTRRIVKPVIVNPPKQNPAAKTNQKFQDMHRQPQKQTVKQNPNLKYPNKKSVTAKPLVKNNPGKKPVPITKNNPADQLAKKPATQQPSTKNNLASKQTPQLKKDTATKPQVVVTKPPVKNNEILVAPSNLKYEQRVNSILNTIAIKNETFTVDFYDNGEIDGDSISVFFNGKLMLSHKRLSDKPISLTLAVDKNREVNELIMYAENLGEIPPNTALMIVHDGGNRYETRIESDLNRNGAIRFTYKPEKPK